MPVDLILDTDIGTDVDDALALAFAVSHPQINLRAVTTVSGDVVRRARIAKKLLILAGRDDVEVAVGLRGEQSQKHRSAEGGHEDAMLGEYHGELPLSERDAVTLLAEEDDAAPSTSRALQLAVVGMQSNVAAAVGQDPTFGRGFERVAVMGGVFAPVRFLDIDLPPTVDHNLNVDQPASLQALNTPMKRLFVPCDVTFNTWLTHAQVDALRKGDPFCRELARQIDIWASRPGRPPIPGDYACLMHDPLTVACTVDRTFVTSMTARVTAAMHEGHVRTFLDPAAGFAAEIITSVDWRGFAQFWLDTVLSR